MTISSAHLNENMSTLLFETTITAISDTFAVIRSQQWSPEIAQCFMYRRHGSGWYGRYEDRVSSRSILEQTELDWEGLSTEFGAVFFSEYPMYNGLVGTASTGSLRTQSNMLLRHFVYETWNRFQTLTPSEEQLEEIAEDFVRFVSSNEFTFRFVAPLCNFATTAVFDELRLPNGVLLIKLSEEEVTELFAGPLSTTGYLQPPPGRLLEEYALCGTMTEQKVFGDFDIRAERFGIEHVKQNLDQIVLALRTFKGMPIGYGGVFLKPLDMVPYSYSVQPNRHEYIPAGHYLLHEAEIEAFSEHATYFAQPLHPSLDIACARLSDASIRTRARDRLLDAVIGLEAILLSSVGGPEYRGEVKYRFAQNYASLFDTPADRHRAAGVARKLYDARSNLAHGNAPKRGAKKRPDSEAILQQTAKEACDVLRELVARFIPSGTKPGYLAEGYWDTRLFGQRD